MLTNIILALAAIAAILLTVVALRPPEFRVTRSARFPGPPQNVFPHIADLRKWDAWSPWAKLDPAAKNSFAGAESGVGQAFSWSGNSKVGEGRMTITESRPSDLVRMRIEFRRPMTATNMTEFMLAPDGEQTTVSWTMSGTNNFMAKAMSLVMDCDKMVGGQFELGLANLRQTVETGRR